ncbi:S-layer homology domain-containing protein [Paenibacillus sinopodophylli]|uniref:S-layer homology domain-containing protein n=1 Tax=Paenibacillus sinopodophylli TaxID=1837342 RepID=UPI00110CE63A|nr:S-layer homology domain-containing protein [Paenibacillus sinopodophylli]
MFKNWKICLSVLLSTALLLGVVGQPVQQAQAAEAQPIIWMPKNADWKYLDTGVDQGNTWRTSYEDKNWATGQAPLGFSATTTKFGNLNTTISFGSDSANKHTTSYFVTKLQVDLDEINSYGQLLGNFGIDDGAVMYVNGTEVYRAGMPEGTITYSTFATSNKSNPVLYNEIDLTAPLKENLQDGENIIAVEVHQSTRGSSDLYFDMELTAMLSAPPLEVSKVVVTFNGDPKTSKGFVWYTPLDSTHSDLEIVEKTSMQADFTNAQAFTGSTSVATNSIAEHVHKAEASALKANTEYFFRVGDKDLNIWSETGVFETAPAQHVPFTFIDLSDTQAKEEYEAILSGQTLAKAMATIPDAKFVVHNGDVVENGNAEEEWNWLLGHSQNSLMHTTIVPAAGNHEPSGSSFYEHFNLQQAKNSATVSGAYYSYDYSNAHFIVLNTNENSTDYANMSVEQVEWLKQDVAKARAAGTEWIILNMHKGPYTTASHATDSDIMGATGLRTKIAPLIAELKIDLVLQGHDHIYARTKPIKSDGTAEDVEKVTETLNGESIEYAVKPDGTIYLIPATAGAKVYKKNTKPQLGDAYFDLFERSEESHSQKYANTPAGVTGQVQNFVGITVDGGKLTAVTYEIDQNLNDAKPFIIDQFGIVKQQLTEPTTPPATNPPVTEPPVTTPPATSPPVTVPVATPTLTPTVTPSPSPVATPVTGGGETVNPAPETSFADTNGHWAEAAIKKAVADGLIMGYNDNTFRPNQVVNRAEFVTILGRAMTLEATGNVPVFKDMDKIPVWAQSHVAKAVQAGIINGYENETFGPSNSLNRAEMVAMIVRAAGIQPDPNAVISFADARDIPAWAVPYVATASKMGLVGGVGGNRFAPLQSATRAQALTIIMTLQNQLGK